MKIGMFQAKCGDYILGYYDTKQDAVKRASEYSEQQALKGWERETDWYVGVVIQVSTKSVESSQQMSDGSGRWKDVINKYDVVVVSFVAFGKATHELSRTDVPIMRNSQGRVR